QWSQMIYHRAGSSAVIILWPEYSPHLGHAPSSPLFDLFFMRLPLSFLGTLIRAKASLTRLQNRSAYLTSAPAQRGVSFLRLCLSMVEQLPLSIGHVFLSGRQLIFHNAHSSHHQISAVFTPRFKASW